MGHTDSKGKFHPHHPLLKERKQGIIQFQNQTDPNNIEHVKAKLRNIALKNSLSNKEMKIRNDQMTKEAHENVRIFLKNKDRGIHRV